MFAVRLGACIFSTSAHCQHKKVTLIKSMIISNPFPDPPLGDGDDVCLFSGTPFSDLFKTVDLLALEEMLVHVTADGVRLVPIEGGKEKLIREVYPPA